METWAFHLGFLLASLAVAVLGILALILSPQQYNKLLEWWMQASSWSEAGVARTQRRWFDFSRRIVGLWIAILGIVMLKPAIAWFLNLPKGLEVPSKEAFSNSVGTSWLALVIALVMSVGGLLNLFSPHLIIQWSIRILPLDRAIPEPTIRKWSIGFRIIGLVALVGGFFAFRIWLRSLA